MLILSWQQTKRLKPNLTVKRLNCVVLMGIIQHLLLKNVRFGFFFSVALVKIVSPINSWFAVKGKTWKSTSPAKLEKQVSYMGSIKWYTTEWYENWKYKTNSRLSDLILIIILEQWQVMRHGHCVHLLSCSFKYQNSKIMPPVAPDVQSKPGPEFARTRRGKYVSHPHTVTRLLLPAHFVK